MVRVLGSELCEAFTAEVEIITFDPDNYQDNY